MLGVSVVDGLGHFCNMIFITKGFVFEWFRIYISSFFISYIDALFKIFVTYLIRSILDTQIFIKRFFYYTHIIWTIFLYFINCSLSEKLYDLSAIVDVANDPENFRRSSYFFLRK